MGTYSPSLTFNVKTVVAGALPATVVLDDIQYQRVLAFGRSAFSVFFHLHAHRESLDYDVSRFSLDHYTCSLLFLHIKEILKMF